MPHPIDYSLYLVTDTGLAAARGLEALAAAAVRGGVTCVQLREKACDSRTFFDRASRLKNLLTPRGIPLIINDRIDIALAVGAEGVHLGQTDLPLTAARAILDRCPDRRMIIGISAESVADATAAEEAGADYISVSPVFDTPTKTDTAPALGLEGVAAVRRAVGRPVVGIGGIGLSNAGAVIAAGADGVAVVSAILSAPSPETAARELKQVIEGARSPWN